MFYNLLWIINLYHPIWAIEYCFLYLLSYYTKQMKNYIKYDHIIHIFSLFQRKNVYRINRGKIIIVHKRL